MSDIISDIIIEDILRCLVLSLLTGTSCQLFFETIVPRRKWRHPWIEYTAVLAFTAGSMVIAFTPIPPYLLQPVRLIVTIAVIAQLYFQMRIAQNLILSTLFCCIYWIISTVVLSAFYTFYGVENVSESIWQTIENLTEAVNLCLATAFYYSCRNRIRKLNGLRWKKFNLFPLLCLIVIMAVNMIPGDATAADKYARLAVISSLTVLFLFIFYFAIHMQEREEALQKLQLDTTRTRSQMNLYHNMQAQYEHQRRFLHDYKNQLNCIQGLLDCGQAKEASQYITRLTGNLRSVFFEINTNHTVVNIILNQKYQTARDKGITMAIVINDLKALTMPEEDLVALLTNLLDNAIEACEKFDKKNQPQHKIIQFKMILEENQLILSVRNPVHKPVTIKNNTIITSKRDSVYHGIGLSNINAVVKKYHGTNSMTCENGWFSFSMLLPYPIQPFFAV